MKISTKLLLSGAVIISLSLIVFGTDAVLSLLTFYQNLESPSAREMTEGVSDSIGSALFGVLMGFFGSMCVYYWIYQYLFRKAKANRRGWLQEKTVL